jgi:hypothetical protein
MAESRSICGVDFSADRLSAGTLSWVTLGIADDGSLRVTQCEPAWQPPGSGKGLTAVIVLLSGRYRLSRGVRRLLQDLWDVRPSSSAVVREE